MATVASALFGLDKKSSDCLRKSPREFRKRLRTRVTVLAIEVATRVMVALAEVATRAVRSIFVLPTDGMEMAVLTSDQPRI